MWLSPARRGDASLKLRTKEGERFRSWSLGAAWVRGATDRARPSRTASTSGGLAVFGRGGSSRPRGVSLGHAQLHVRAEAGSAFVPVRNLTGLRRPSVSENRFQQEAQGVLCAAREEPGARQETHWPQRSRTWADTWACGAKVFASAFLGSTCHHGLALSAPFSGRQAPRPSHKHVAGSSDVRAVESGQPGISELRMAWCTVLLVATGRLPVYEK